MPWKEDTIEVDEVGLLDVEGLVVIVTRLGASTSLASLGRLRLQALESSDEAQSVRTWTELACSNIPSGSAPKKTASLLSRDPPFLPHKRILAFAR